MEKLSDFILRENRTVFDEMVGHRFVEDIKADTLPTSAFERYLVFEGAFVETAISIFAYATAKAETMTDRRWLIGVLDALANSQIAYFEKTFAARGIDVAGFDVDIPAVARFRDGMLAIARDGGFIDTIAAMFAAEWMYWTWSQQVEQNRISDPLLAEWIGLHTDETFAAQAIWLKDRLNVAGEALSEAERAHLSAVFGEAMRLEIDFHSAVYEEDNAT
ncbi:TenA family transcriptional regulator [Martelella lutilitoris]|uniref:Aminopyrimidine aminohydrolase n=1 Tax=Martelella lutilitoris TaxID=2583532 RepID=A0A5C4JSG9_9HYPH|nr:TenA family protein [Martelella lutilitoris]TNB48114.1 TenA family transcriptional regulator [Martelella lutilitoris]